MVEEAGAGVGTGHEIADVDQDWTGPGTWAQAPFSTFTTFAAPPNDCCGQTLSVQDPLPNCFTYFASKLPPPAICFI